MWQTNGFSQDDVVGAFLDFLESPIYKTWAKAQDEEEKNSITLADAIQGWLEEGDGIKLFSTYTSFLLGVISIIDEWTIHGDCKTLVDSYVDPVNKRSVQLFQSIETVEVGDSSFYSGFRFIGRTTFHPIMQQNYFEMLRARATSRTT
ncbi:hypothetical protein ABCS02_14095 [Microbacterium sp. X-17]|uniref:hypothetical protein n=1 Tax=Microbacterium sp. X-17 TaxID=3144404 RepID=UPI0031F4FD23